MENLKEELKKLHTVSEGTIKVIKKYILPNMNIDDITKRNLDDIIDYLEYEITSTENELNRCEDDTEKELKKLSMIEIESSIKELKDMDLSELDFDDFNNRVFS